MQTIWQDFRYGLRMLLKNPGFTLVAIITLALGIGANTAIFSVANAVLFRPLPYPDSDRMVRIEEKHEGRRWTNVTFASFLDMGTETESLNYISAWRFWNFNLTEGGQPERVTGAMVSAEFFNALGVAPHTGRAFLPQEDLPASNNVAIIGFGLWQRRFGGEVNLIGKNIRISDDNYTVVGVMPLGFDFPNQTELWTPLAASGSLRNNRRAHLLQVIARLKPQATLRQAESDMVGITRRIEEQNKGVDPGLNLSLFGLQQRIVEPVKPALVVLLFAVGFVLLIACANTANLMLTRAASREKEIAVRLALGAGRWRLIRQLLTESILLALLGGGLGLLLAFWSIDLIAAFDPGNIPRLEETGIDNRVLIFSLLATIGAGVLFGLAPAIQATKTNLNESLKEGGRSGESVKSNRLRDLLVVGEIALALVLLVGAGLLINSFWRLMQVNPGFDSHNVLTMQVTLSSTKYSDDGKITNTLQRMLERVKTVPGVTSVGLINTLPLNGGPATTLEVVGRPVPEPGQEQSADIRIISPDYFRSMGIGLIGGRGFDDRDGAASKRVVVVNESLARRYWPNENPIGKQVTMKDWGEPLTGEVVGIVNDVKPDGLDTDTRPMLYWPYPQFPSTFNAFTIRTSSDPNGVIAAVKARIWEADKDQAIASVQTMEELVSQSVGARRFNMMLFGVFGAIALLMSAIGIYGVISYSVAQRTREIGVRMALGAQVGDVLSLVIKQGMTRALAGIGIGLIASFALTRLMTGLLFGINATDPLTFAAISLLLALAALLACYIPARRATKIDPIEALHYE